MAEGRSDGRGLPQSTSGSRRIAVRLRRLAVVGALCLTAACQPVQNLVGGIAGGSEQGNSVSPAASESRPTHAVACLDGSGSYGEVFWGVARDMLATAIRERLAFGIGSTTVWIKVIDDNSYDHTSTLTTIRIPALPPLPEPPDLDDNPFTAAAEQEAYVGRLRELERALAAAESDLTAALAPLEGQAFPDARATDVYGCVHAAAELLDDPAATHRLLIASDLDHNAQPPSKAHLDLTGVNVHVFAFRCDEAAVCGARREEWTEALSSLGANSVRITAPEQESRLF